MLNLDEEIELWEKKYTLWERLTPEERRAVYCLRSKEPSTLGWLIDYNHDRCGSLIKGLYVCKYILQYGSYPKKGHPLNSYYMRHKGSPHCTGASAYERYGLKAWLETPCRSLIGASRIVEAAKKGTPGLGDSWINHRNRARAGKLKKVVEQAYKDAGLWEALKRGDSWGAVIGLDRSVSARANNLSSIIGAAKEVEGAVRIKDVTVTARDRWYTHRKYYAAGTLPEEAVNIYKKAGLLKHLKKGSTWGEVIADLKK